MRTQPWAKGQPLDLLLADDDEDTRFIVKRALAKLGAAVHVHEAANGEEALTLLRERRVDAILTDYRMPLATGVEVLCFARHAQPHAKRILMSGTLEEAVLREAALPACLDFCFEKPMQREEWMKLLRLGLEIET